VPQLVECPNCKSMRLPHNVCPSCGFYKDHVVVAQKAAQKEETK
ncbi:MAG: 50S ribosomal protein L32, partial [Elusimicrobiaceae bacterium]|nr:50S ribosomal protein L32 [Elusimicrobiaceae bacterium]MBQ8843347.1 50S ribosomal protein L32 [Elusimicrobiaceae bacterium]